MKRVLLLFLAAGIIVGPLTPPASAHVHRRIDPSVCPISWSTPASNEKLVRCVSNYFGADTPVVLAIAACESGFQTPNPNPASTADGTFQYLAGTWTSAPHRPHGLPGMSGAQRTHGRYAAIVAVRYMVHQWRNGQQWPYGPWRASQGCWGYAL